MFQNIESTTIFELASSGSGGELFWIHEIENPSEFFAGCKTPLEVLDRIIESESGVDDTVETCGYTLVLDRPEDPSPDRAGDPPENPTFIEVIHATKHEQRFEVMETEHEQGRGNQIWDEPVKLCSESFYKIEDPVKVFGNVWGSTTAMFEAIQNQGIEPILEYDDISFTFIRPTGSL